MCKERDIRWMCCKRERGENDPAHTNILIETHKGNEEMVKMVRELPEMGTISSIGTMKLFYGALDK